MHYLNSDLNNISPKIKIISNELYFYVDTCTNPLYTAYVVEEK